MARRKAPITVADKPKRKWIKAATAGAHGQFRDKAEKAGETTREFAAEKADAPGKLGKEARLAETLMSMHHKGGSRAAKLYRSKSVRKD
jgi:hypothetical protein